MPHAAKLRTLIADNTAADGIFATDVPRLALIRSGRQSDFMHVLYEPALCLVAQGAKQVLLGQDIYTYNAERYLVVSVDLPVISQVIEATAEEPYLCLRLDLNIPTLNELALELGLKPPRTEGSQPGLRLAAVSRELEDAACRLLELLESPRDIPILAPIIEREILYRLLLGDESSMVLQIAFSESRLSQINKAITSLKRSFRQPLRIDDLAAKANMSTSSFHLHFKQVTGMSPLQYQKALRLQEARRLLLGLSLDAATVGYSVGYESPSQFSREYARLFGEPPVRDLAKLRQLPSYYLEA